MTKIHFLQPLCQDDQISVCVCLRLMLRIHFRQMLSNQKQLFKLSLRNLALLQISKTDFKFFLASEHFNNSSSLSLATALCLTLHKKINYILYPLSAEKATPKANIKVFPKLLLFILLYETISPLPLSPQGNMFRSIHIAGSIHQESVKQFRGWGIPR